MGAVGSRILFGSAIFASAWALAALAGPAGPNVVGGSATIQGAGSGTVTINQTSQNAIINWQTFNIGRNETTTFVQPGSSSTALNRVIGGRGPSLIDGTLSANGRVFIINGDGVLFGPHSVINTAGFLASTNDIRNEDFMAGRYNFNIPGRPDASIVNLGNITAASGGFAALVAPGVRNSGTITAALGTVTLAAGNAFTLDFYGDRLITLAVNDQIASTVIDVATGQPLKALVGNAGKLSANGGRVELTAAAARAVVDSVINNSGVMEANSIGTRNGMIVLGAATAARKPAGAPTQTVKVSGTISAAGKDKGTKGGTVLVTGENIQLAGAQINASGNAGGGKVLIGGDTGGGKLSPAAAALELAKLESFAIPTASTVSVDAATTINASATGQGNGGKVVVWSDQQTNFAGTILALGGPSGGNGGFVETSSHGLLNYAGVADLRAPNGTTGTLLLDPYDVIICVCDPENGSFSDGVWTPTQTSKLNVNDLRNELADANVQVTTGGGDAHGGNINVNVGVTWTSNSTLTLSAANSININAAISATNGGLTLNAGNAISASAAVNVATFTLQNGSWNQVSSTLPAFSANDFRISGGSFLRALGGDGSSGSPYQITDVYGLQGIGSSATLLAGNYVLANNVDASGTVNWNAGAGFLPIGNLQHGFAGLLDGQAHTIDALTINSSAAYVGLFGVVAGSGAVRNLGITNVNLTSAGWNGPEDYAHVGALAGINNGSIVGSFATGTITSNSPDSTAPDTGGLVGTNRGLISQSYAIVNVSDNSTGGGLFLEGLVGWNQSTGTITQSYASGPVATNISSTSVGGLAGVNSGTVTSSYWDTQTSGQSTSAGGTGLTTAQFQAGLPSGFDPTVWGSLSGINNGHPYLLWQAPSVAQLEGIVYSNGTPVGAGVTVFDIVNGTVLGSVTTAANGSYDFVLPAGAISPSGLQVLTYTTGANAGAAYQQNVTGSVNNLNIYVSYLSLTSGAGTLSAVSSGLSTAIGGNATVQALVNGLSNRQINATASSFTIDQAISMPSGALTLNAGGSITATATVNVGSFTLAGGNWMQVASALPSFGAQSFNIAGGSFLRVSGGDGSTGTPYQITDVYGLQGIGSSSTLRTANYVLASNIDATGTANWNGGSGFVPIGNISFGGFTGSFDGKNYAIKGLAIAPTDPNVNNIGLFGTIYGSVSNLNLTNVNIAANPNVSGPGQFVGALAGQNAGTIVNVSVTGVVNGTPGGVSLVGVIAGGLVGQNGFFGGTQGGTPATITQSFANVSLTVGDSCQGVECIGGQNNVGGLAGSNSSGATIADSQAIGGVGAGVFSNAGGLVGQNYGTINGSTTPVPVSACAQGAAFTCASGGVSVGSFGQAGGLIGFNSGIVSNVFATGAAMGSAGQASNQQFGGNQYTLLGGLVATNQGTISNAFATGAVGQGGVAYLQAGGLVGQNGGSITYSFATGNVTAGDNSTAGGLAAGNFAFSNNCGGCGQGDGYNTSATIASSYAGGNVTGGASSTAGGLVGTNSSGSTITDSQAFGSVSAGGNGNSQFGNFTNAGGLAGQNSGTINSSTTPVLASICAQGAAFTCASGAVSVGTAGQAGGLIGFNDGIVSNVFAIGTVSGAAGQASTQQNNFSQFTLLGGLVAMNQGTISNAFATGAVGQAGVAYLQAGGLVGQNSGSITYSFAAVGAVAVGDFSTAGGLVGSNFVLNNNCNSCSQGDGYNASATIAWSYAGGTVTGGASSTVGGLVAQNSGSVASSFATGAVTVGDNGTAGGLIGSNFANVPQQISDAIGFADVPLNLTGSSGSVTLSYAGGNVTGGVSSTVGGLVGMNSAGAIITDSQAFGNVSAGGNGSSQFSNFTNAGGLVGQNSGTIASSAVPVLASICAQGAAFTCAGGAVTVGSLGQAGGLIGFNNGIVTNVFATGAVTGAAGQAPSDQNNFFQLTQLGGLIGTNQGTVANAFATGAVGTVGIAYLQAGGLISQNAGSVSGAFATGAVAVGDNSTAGGLVGNNSPNNNNGCEGCIQGDGSSNAGSILSSYATGNVAGGNSSLVGGLVGANNGAIALSSASGNVSVTANGGFFTSFAGGLVGQNGNGGNPAPSATIMSSYASGTVTGTGVGLGVGGLVGNNAAGSTVTDSQAFVSVNALTNADPHSESNNSVQAGGLVGSNQGIVAGTNTPSLSSACAQGASYSCAAGSVNVGSLGQAGGLVGSNQGTVGNSFASGAVKGAAGVASDQQNGEHYTRLGGLIGSNHGTATNSFATGAVGMAGVAYLQAGGLIGQNNGSVTNSFFANGTVIVGDFSIAGGLVRSEV
jgi:filamentous hemagglutinin family protein